MAMGWLQDNLRIIMEKHRALLWNLGNFYLDREPMNAEKTGRDTDVFLGFSLKIYSRGKGYSLCVSTGVKYLDTRPLEWYIQEGENVKYSPPRRGIYKNGCSWYEIDVLDKTGASIRDQMIPALRDSVLNYIRKQSANGNGIDPKTIDPESPAFEYQYPHRPEVKHFANSRWAHFSFGTNDGRVRSLHHLSKMRPQERLSRVQNIAFGILLGNRQWLYRLGEPLHHDISIGVDISNRQVGMSLFDGKSGDLIFDFDFSGKTIKDARYRREKLPEKVMFKMSYDLLKKGIQTLRLDPRSIVVHRDGRPFDSEWDGLQRAIRTLQEEGLLGNEVAYGIVEIYKKSVCMPRLVSHVGDRMENPSMGSYELINNKEAILVNTGFPARLDGTAQPLLVRLSYGNLNFVNVLHDIFKLSNLCYAAPDKPQSLPLTLKIIDDFLTPLSYDIESPGYDEEDMESTVDMDDLVKLDAIGV
ncbi:MAG: hypothetical protein HY731_09465 [Candidatus Tectomicrobia bacterium]|nr:hypothetical protein [Candidatus Tectomicrobia bacterium]